MNYYFERILPNLLRVHEDVASYPLTLEEARENLEFVKRHRYYYASDDIYLRRVQFYEDALATLNGGTQS